jgi:tetratricopeptide (TPR) repeat protein
MSNQAECDPRLECAHHAASTGEFGRAERLLNEVLADDASSLMALDLLGFVLYFLGRPAEAEQACRRSLAINPERAYPNKGLGLCLAKQGKLDQGLPYLGRAIELEPAWLDPRWDMAIVLSEVGRNDDALEVLAQAQQAVPAEQARISSLRDEILSRSRELGEQH